MKPTTALSLEAALKAALLELRSTLAEADISYLDLTINASGRTLDGDLEVTFTLGTNYSQNAAKGGSLFPVITEHLRRHGWTQRNAPLCLPAVPVGKEEEPITN